MKKEQEFPEESGEIYKKLQSEIMWLHARWIIFEQLFTNSEERVEMLNETASSYFFITQHALFNDILLFLSRILDKSKLGKDENLSLEQLITHIDKDKYPDLESKMRELLEKIHSLSVSLKTYRNKKLAHYDLDVALGKAEFTPRINFLEIKNILKAIRDFMNEYEGYFLNSDTAYDYCLSIQADGKALINKLKKAYAYEELEKLGLIERGYWHRKSKYKTS
jgi:hypothetical protein